MTKRAPPDIPLEELRKRFHLPLAEVAKEFGVCMTFIKKVCRSHGIKRWPYRKIKSLQNKASKLSALRACHAAKAVEKHVDAIRELTGHTMSVTDDFDDDGLSDDGEAADESMGPLIDGASSREAMISNHSRTGPQTMNPALLRASAPQHMQGDVHPYAYGQEALGGGTPRVSLASHNALRDALLGSAAPPAPGTMIPEQEPRPEDTDELCAQSDLAFEELWGEGMWSSMPSPVSAMISRSQEQNPGSGSAGLRRMPRVGSSGRLRDLDDYPGMPSGGMPRNPSFERLHGMSAMQRDRSFDRLDRIARERSYDRLHNLAGSYGDGHHRLPPRTLSSERLDRMGVKREEIAGAEELEDRPTLPGQGMRRNMSSGSLREYMQRGAMPRSSSYNSLNEFAGPSRGQSNAGPDAQHCAGQMPRTGSNNNLWQSGEEADADVLLGDTVFVF